LLVSQEKKEKLTYQRSCNIMDSQQAEECSVETTTYVRYFRCKIGVDRIQTIPVRDVNKAIAEAPQEADGFLFYDVSTMGGIGTGAVNISGKYFMCGVLQDENTFVKCEKPCHYPCYYSFDPTCDNLVGTS